MTPREANLAIIAAMTGVDPDFDAQIQQAVIEKLGDDAFTLSDAALELMAAEYRRLNENARIPAPAGRH